MITPSIVEKYRLGDSLGVGGFGEVFRARRDDLDREDAIKILHGAHCRDAAAVARFIAEARAANQIEHPGIVRVHAFGELADGRSYYVMELLRGRTLRALLDERGRLPVAEALPLLAKYAEAIDAAHAAGVAHRDLKPENLFVEPDGSIRVIDFGLAKLATEDDLTTTGRVMGSPRYMSPEQCRGSGADTRSDLYSFGALAYHVLVGAPPFDGEPLALALHHLNDRPPAPSSRIADLPESIDAVLLALLDKDPERRPRPLSLAVAGMRTGLLPPARTRNRLWIVGGAVGAVTGAIALTLAVLDHDSTPSNPSAQPQLRVVDSIAVETTGFPFLDRDGTGVVAIKDTGSVRYEIGSHTITDREYVTTVADGRRLVDNENGSRLFDPKTATSELISLASASPSPDGTKLSTFSDKRLDVYDVVSRTRRTLSTAPSGTSRLAQWSPDGTQLVWLSARRTLNITRVLDGRTRELALPILNGKGGPMPAAFVDNDHIVYCAIENGRVSVRERSTSLIGDAGTILRELDPRVNECAVSAVHGRVAVAQMFGATQVAMLDLAGPIPHDVALAAEGWNLSVIDVSPDGSKLMVQSTTSPTPEELDRTTNTQTPRPKSCGRASALPTLHVSSGWGFYETTNDATSTTIRIIAPDCSEVGVWRFPLRATVTSPRCRGGVCAILTYGDHILGSWALEPGKPPRTLGQVAVPEVEPELASWGMDVSPDGERVVALDYNLPFAVVFETSGAGAPTKMTLPGTPQAVVWGSEPHRFIVSGMQFGGSQFAVIAVDLDGHTETLWKSQRTWFWVQGRSANGLQIFGDVQDGRTEVLVFDTADLPSAVPGQGHTRSR